jgi:site-specific recombinase XerD
VLWLNRRGLPVMPGTWQSMFGDANDRCRRNDVALRAHPHLLRHTYAVVTLEQLQDSVPWSGVVRIGEPSGS